MDSINNHACKFGSDAWLELQAFKTRQLNRREKLNRHKNLHKDLVGACQIGPPTAGTSPQTLAQSTGQPTSNSQQNANQHSPYLSSPSVLIQSSARNTSSSSSSDTPAEETNKNNASSSLNSSLEQNESPPRNLQDQSTTNATQELDQQNPQQINLDLVECLLLLKLCDVALKLPIDSKSLQRSICKIRGLETTPRSLVENLLQKFAHQELISIEEPNASILIRRKGTSTLAETSNDDDDDLCFYVTSADHTKLVEFDKSFGSLDNIRSLLIDSKMDDSTAEDCDDYVPIQSVRGYANDIRNACNNLCSPIKQGHLYEETLDTRAYSTNKSYSQHDRSKKQSNSTGDDLERLLSLSSTRERENKKLGEELLELLSKPTAKERNLLERFRSADGYQVQEFCPKGTKGECRRNNNGAGVCDKLHFKKIIAKHTEESLGDCSFLNTCFHMDSCKYVHYEVDYDDERLDQISDATLTKVQFKRPHPAESRNRDGPNKIGPHLIGANKPTQTSCINSSSSSNNNSNNSISINSSCDDKAVVSLSISATKDRNNNKSSTSMSLPANNANAKYILSPEEQAFIDSKNRKRFKTVLYPPQWIQCDLRFFDMSLLGKFSVVMADPPWDIHMELPYGTMSDDEMRKLNIPTLQDEGVIFLWVTGRAMELGRECLALWGYERCDEIIWVKTNQLQRIIRTGRTGHWLNHGKEHCLVGVKGNPKDINRGLDCDVIVAEVRATSHKPDEIYGIIERLSPGTRKIELFGRAHNVQPNWITLGNQLNGVRLVEPSLVNALKKLNLPFQPADHNAA